MVGIDVIQDFFPTKIHALITNRQGGFSSLNFKSLNLGLMSGDSVKLVKKNRSIIREYLESDIVWMNQTHSSDVSFISKYSSFVNADGIITRNSELACAVLTADCLPILFCSSDAELIGSIHAGWKGLSSGILENFFKKIVSENFFSFNNPNSKHLFYFWFGPCICKNCYEVGDEVKTKFSILDQNYDEFFEPAYNKWYFDMQSLAVYKTRTFFNSQEKFVIKIKVDNRCTYEDDKTFFSYRRDGKTGRMASVIATDK